METAIDVRVAITRSGRVEVSALTKDFKQFIYRKLVDSNAVHAPQGGAVAECRAAILAAGFSVSNRFLIG